MRECFSLPGFNCSDPVCQTGSDDGCRYEEWLHSLDEDVIQADFGYEPGEFTVYPAAWESLFREGLSPAEAWQRALDAHRAANAH